MLTDLRAIPQEKHLDLGETHETGGRLRFRHPFQTFSWIDRSWDIAAIERAIDAGSLRPTRITLDRAFIESYAQKVLGLTMPDAHEDGAYAQRSLWMRLDLAAAKALPEAALNEPVLIIHVGAKRGMLRLLDTATPEHVLGDGQHRMAKAFLCGSASLEAYVLSKRASNMHRLASSFCPTRARPRSLLARIR